MTIDLDVLEGLARQAAEEPWGDTVSGPICQGDDVMVKVADGRDWPVIAHHIHAFKPETALALIAAARERDALREALKRIADGEADGLDLARDSMVLERAIRIARQALKQETQS